MGIQYPDLKDIKESKGLVVLHINIRSLLPKLSLFIHDFLDGKLDIVLVSESWLKKGLNDNLFIVPGYHFIRKDRPTVKRGGGLCIYLKDNIIYEELHPCDNGYDDKDLESLCLKLHIGGHKKLILLLVYRPPKGNPQEAIKSIKTSIEFVNQNHRNCELVIMGDLNINYQNRECSHVKSLKMLETIFEMKQLIDHEAIKKAIDNKPFLSHHQVTSIQIFNIICYTKPSWQKTSPRYLLSLLLKTTTLLLLRRKLGKLFHATGALYDIALLNDSLFGLGTFTTYVPPDRFPTLSEW